MRRGSAALLAVGALCWAGTVRAGDGLSFFDDDSLSFDNPKGPAAKPGPAEGPGSEPQAPGVQAPPAVEPTQSEFGSGVRVASPPRPQRGVTDATGAVRPGKPDRPAAVPRPGGFITTGGEKAPVTIAPDRGRAGDENRSAASMAVAPAGSAVELDRTGDVQVLKVRELNAEERRSMKGSLTCSDPLAAELRVNGRMKAVLGTALGLRAERVPDTVSWIFGRTGRCFQRPAGPVSGELDRLDGVARMSARRIEGN